MSRYSHILNKLADGDFHSGEVLAAELGVTRAAIWKQLKKIESMGIAIDSVRGKGYRLQQALDLLDIERIRDFTPESTRVQIAQMHLFADIDSTHRYLMDACKQSSDVQVCLAESQSHGRGRRGRLWVSPFASNIYLSVSWHYTTGPMSLSGLSLALGIAVMRVLSAYVANNIGLKWPNDIYAEGKKLGGILVEFSGDVSGPCQIVAGLGLNVRMPKQWDKDIDQPWTDLHSLAGQKTPGRNRLAAELVTQMIAVLCDYPEHGFAHYHKEWDQWDFVRGKTVHLCFPTHKKQGIVKGVNPEGALLLETSSGTETFNSGEISLKIQS